MSPLVDTPRSRSVRAKTKGNGSIRILIIVQNLPVPFDRRVWLECRTLTRAGYQVAVVCPKGGYFWKGEDGRST
jgi:hypothetical protein